jgi:hypothetical protein
MLDRSSKNVQISNVVKIRPVGAELVHVDGRTDRAKLKVVFRNLGRMRLPNVLLLLRTTMRYAARTLQNPCGGRCEV